MVKSARTPPAGQVVGGDVGHVGDGHRFEAGQPGQLGQGLSRLGEHAVDAGRTVGVGGDLGDDEHGRPGHLRMVCPWRGRYRLRRGRRCRRDRRRRAVHRGPPAAGTVAASWPPRHRGGVGRRRRELGGGPSRAGSFSPTTSLPLALCNMAALVAAAACWWRTALLVELTYFWGLAGTLQAVITPDLNAGFPHLVFFQYTVGHLGIVVAAVYLVVGLGLVPRPRSR